MKVPIQLPNESGDFDDNPRTNRFVRLVPQPSGGLLADVFLNNAVRNERFLRTKDLTLLEKKLKSLLLLPGEELVHVCHQCHGVDRPLCGVLPNTQCFVGKQHAAFFVRIRRAAIVTSPTVTGANGQSSKNSKSMFKKLW